MIISERPAADHTGQLPVAIAADPEIGRKAATAKNRAKRAPTLNEPPCNSHNCAVLAIEAMMQTPHMGRLHSGRRLPRSSARGQPTI